MHKTRKLKNKEKVQALTEFLDSTRNKPYFTAEELTDGILFFLNSKSISLTMQDKMADAIYNHINNARGAIITTGEPMYDDRHSERIETLITYTEERLLDMGMNAVDGVADNLAIYLKEEGEADSTLIYGASGRLYKVLAEVKGDNITPSLLI